MKKLLLLSAIILQSIIANAQKYEWLSHTTQGDFNGLFEPVAPVGVDPSGNVYTAIQTTSSGTVIQGDTFPSFNGQKAIVVAKFDPLGNLIWGKTISSDGGPEISEQIAVDDAGSVYISAYMGGANSIMNDTVYPNQFAPQIIKINSSGNFIRTLQYPGSTYDLWRVATLGADLYMSRTATIQKMDSASNVIWSVSDSNSILSFSRNGLTTPGLFVQTNGELIVSFQEAGNNSIGPVPFGNGVVPLTTGGGNEIGVIKMDTSGQVLWARVLLFSTSPPQIKAVALDHQGNAYLGIYHNATTPYVFAGDSLFSPFGALPIAPIFKWNASGIPQWARGLYSAGGNGVRINDLSINAQEELLVSGGCYDMSFNGDTTLDNNNAANGFLIKINPSGTFQWFKSEPNVNFGTNSMMDGIAVRNGNEYILAGNTTTDAGTYIFGCFQFTVPLFKDNTFITLITEQPECSLVGIKDKIKKDYKTAVYPNPTDGILTLSFKGNENESCNIDLIDVSGRIILNEKVIAVEGANKYQMDLRSVAKGIYVLLLKSEGMNEMVKVVVE